MIVVCYFMKMYELKLIQKLILWKLEEEDITKRQNSLTENFVSSLYLLIQSSTLKKCIEHCLTALATLLHVLWKLCAFVLLNVLVFTQ